MSHPYLIRKLDFYDLTIDFLPDVVIKDVKKHKTEKLILNYQWEAKLVTDPEIVAIRDFVAKLRNEIDIPILGIFNTFWKEDEIELSKIFDSVLFIDFFLIKSFNLLVIQHKEKLSYRWNQSSDKYLFLTGKPAKYNRTRLLWKLARANLLKENSIWSSYLSIENSLEFINSRILVPELSLTQFKEFAQEYKNNPDQLRYIHTPESGYTWLNQNYQLHNVNLYTNTRFSIVSETFFNTTKRPWITEKTWYPIMNRHPFIMAGDTCTLDKLSKLGFVTFEEFMLHTDYDTVEDPDLRLDHIVENTKDFLTKKHLDLTPLLDHNRKIFDNLYDRNIQKIQDFIRQNQLKIGIFEMIKIDGFQPEQIMNHEDFKKTIDNVRWNKFYNSIKDDSWPPCPDEDDYPTLPAEIRKECQEIFGYIPK